MEINTNVAVPPISRRGQERKYPFNEMHVGASVSFPTDKLYVKARSAVRGHMSKHGGVWVSRKGYQIVEGEARYTGEGGTIWRVE
jgi:hypothetical protein